MDGILELVQQAIDMVAEAAPHLWEIALRQVAVLAAGEGIAIFGWLVGMIACLIPARLCFKHHIATRDKYSNEGQYAAGGGFLAFMALACFLFLLYAVYDLIGYLVNPNLHAIQVIVDMVK